MLFVFEGVRDYRDNKEKKAKKSIAVNKLDEYIKLYLSAAYCSLNGKTKKLNVHRMNASQIKQIVNDSFFEEFKSVDLLKAVHHQELNGLQFIGHQIDRLQNDVKQVLNIYELYLPAELVMLIEQVINNHLLVMVNILTSFVTPDYRPTNDNLRVTTDPEMIKHINDVVKLIEELEKHKSK